MVAPGEYLATLEKQADGLVKEIAGPVNFYVERLYSGALKGSEPKETVAFWKEVSQLERLTSAGDLSIKKSLKKIRALELAISRTQEKLDTEVNNIYNIKMNLYKLNETLSGNKSKDEIGEKSKPTILSRLYAAIGGTMQSAYGPTPTHRKSLEIAKKQFVEFEQALKNIIEIEIPEIERALIEAGAPVVE